MSDANYHIRCMTRPEIDLCVSWAAAEGWNPGLYDADAFYAAESEGFLVGLLNDEPIACISDLSVFISWRQVIGSRGMG